MSDKKEKNNKPFEIPRPTFPKRAVVTGGMPYGNKELHFGHVGGMLVFADTYARFLRDRIGKENVIFVSGTDCYGSPIAEGWRVKVEKGEFEGTLEDFVRRNHNKQKETLDAYGIEPNLFAASGLGRSKEIHAEVTDKFISSLHKKGQLEQISTMQFFDEKAGVFLNGRQVVGKCPVEGCCSEKGYADECDLGHQYMPEMLIDPISTLTGERPTMKPVTNWYFKLGAYEKLMKDWVETLKKRKDIRPVVWKTIDEFLKQPMIYIKRDFEEKYLAIKDQLPAHEYLEEKKKPSFTILFNELADCDAACHVLAENGIRYRTGKTLVPFRLTGNIEWGVPAPVMDGVEGLTVWVWPESLWAPISFTQTYLEQQGRDRAEWKDYWCSKDATVYQFIGQDNIYFYGIAEPAMWMAQQESAEKTADPAEGELQMPVIVANHHILFLNKKASSSGSVKPPMADDLLDYYTPEQLRMHWLEFGLGQQSVSFFPKPFNKPLLEEEAALKAEGQPINDPKFTDPVTKNALLTNVYNRMIRTAFYTLQKRFDGVLPDCAPEEKILADAKKAVLDYERQMARFAFHQCTYVLDSYIRNGSKYMAKALAKPDDLSDEEISQALANLFHIVKTAGVLLHPMAPFGTEKLRDYLQVDERIWSWDTIFEPLTYFVENGHKLKFLPPRTDFFARHESQFAQSE
ncbi:methionyl-tRNA synthetase [Ruminococcus sp. YE71]|uniref:class I tRNA ligase family protein n=1 Tax=unclassified Ruminococcus TaxID=2608920 RepID=UPI000887DBD2|nr:MULTISPECIES: class I tRNA ligase family protein [unclassified Ruminococcus]SDA19754.1 methionyl-tRNA synthetase [Ruminococcus sp. YE78]SFW31286.1 methionyl-tRNA synthetase [Ruminococcus sp. YE71]